MAADIPNVRLFNFVDNPAAIQFSRLGEGVVRLDPASGSTIVDVRGYRKVSIQIGATSAKRFVLSLGKLQGATLGQAFARARDNNIHTFGLVGPEMALWLVEGTPNTRESVQLWVYLSS